MNIRTIQKILKTYETTKELIVVKSSGKGRYYIKNKDKDTLAFFNIENNKITYLNLINKKTNEDIFSVLYCEHYFNNIFSNNINIYIEDDIEDDIDDEKIYNLYECEKLFGFLNDILEDEEELKTELTNTNRSIENIKNNIENTEIKIKRLNKNGHNKEYEKLIALYTEQLLYYKDKLTSEKKYFKVLNDTNKK